MSWDIEGDSNDKAGDYHIPILSENTSYDIMVNYGVYTDNKAKTGTKLPAGAKLPYGTLVKGTPLTIALLKGAIWNAGVTVVAGAAVAVSLY